ncbi:hypothetical protein H8R23_12900 [Flavobacterium sp. F-380]|jgi:hypothetical protein|uniref:Apple domain-containing protein n=1 Tax=Flavobacterium kayseriense TaxID=2764714 RepID=A0ABR7J9U1_9FLAO|nr:hypothetical protein [Flavobacterium kayseriense]MBC5842307.1 hypothetical protein [Flavobacterium kayseriense]MBC5848837.1 hypothetical protein [Flavobacterium kayseriense]MBU0940266.1 hypothetical protein [Bacteroidota bacterium]
MNTLNQQTMDFVPISKFSGMGKRSNTLSCGVMLADKIEVAITESSAGLCSNCDANSYCTLQRTNKMFCELYN